MALIDRILSRLVPGYGWHPESLDGRTPPRGRMILALLRIALAAAAERLRVAWQPVVLLVTLSGVLWWRGASWAALALALLMPVAMVVVALTRFQLRQREDFRIDQEVGEALFMQPAPEPQPYSGPPPRVVLNFDSPPLPDGPDALTHVSPIALDVENEGLNLAYHVQLSDLVLSDAVTVQFHEVAALEWRCGRMVAMRIVERHPEGSPWLPTGRHNLAEAIHRATWRGPDLPRTGGVWPLTLAYLDGNRVFYTHHYRVSCDGRTGRISLDEIEPT